MMTVLFVLIGLVVFFISFFKHTFTVSFKRLVLIALTGFVLDVLIGLFVFTFTYASLS